MDLSQKKLTKAEWLNVEIPVTESEKQVLDLIVKGYHNVNLKENYNLTLVNEMKLKNVVNIHEYLYEHYFLPIITPLLQSNPTLFEDFQITIKKSSKQLKKIDTMRIKNMDSKIKTIKHNLFEFILLEFATKLLDSYVKGTTEYAFYLYTLIHVLGYQISDTNPFVVQFLRHIIDKIRNNLIMHDVLSKAYEFIEKNKHLLKFADMELFDHQKQIFTLFKQSPMQSKLVLYTAPTGTGKTLTPLGLSEGHRIIFICAARHIGLALAKSAISVDKPIAIAFGCDTADDIRLHYYAASTYSRNKRSGGIGKVDNSDGSRVKIMICDVQSYIVAMNYMLAFSPDCDEEESRDDDIITYWDEPTISMDYDNHPLHEIIEKTWQENQISKVVLSCATLPHREEIQSTLSGFQIKFENAQINSINSYDCRKSIALLESNGKCVLPHLLYEDFENMQISYEHINQNRSLLRYLDLQEIIKFIQLVHITENAIPQQYQMNNYFEEGIEQITMNNLKLYYLTLLARLNKESYPFIHEKLKSQQLGKFIDPTLRKYKSVDTPSTFSFGGGESNAGKPLTKSQSVMVPNNQHFDGVLLTTKDAHTLTDGPTIYLAENVENLAKFYVHKSSIPAQNLQRIMANIQNNTIIQKRITSIENTIEEKLNKLTVAGGGDVGGKKGNGGKVKTDKLLNRDSDNSDMKKLNQKLQELKEQIQITNLDNVYVPNSTDHQFKWLNDRVVKNAFQPSIDDEVVQEIMMLDVSDYMKMLLLMGIGLFVKEANGNPRYMEIIKKLAYEQNLFLIIACSDYIYGTNYQFCHGFIGKDLLGMTQQKTIQALGRIGRNQTQQEYTVRFRDDKMVKQLFHPPSENKEAEVMNQLFA